MMTRQERIEKILELCAKGLSFTEVGVLMGCSRHAVAGLKRKAREAKPAAKRGRPPGRGDGPDVQRKRLALPAPVAAPVWESRFARPQDRRAGR